MMGYLGSSGSATTSQSTAAGLMYATYPSTGPSVSVSVTSPGSQMTFSTPSMARSSASASALVQPGLRLGLRTQVSAVISVPSPSERNPPPSTTRFDRYAGRPASEAIRSPRAASLS